MGTVIIFIVVAILSLAGLLKSLKSKNLLGIVFAGGAVAVFSWFSIMTILHNGYPPAL
jgi:uncharacterized membrane protein